MQKGVLPKRLKPMLQDTITVNWRDRLLTLSGLNPGLLLIILVVLYFSGQFILRMIDTPTKETLEKVVTSISTEHKTLHQDHLALTDELGKARKTLEIQTFLMTKPDKERLKYKLDEPEALRYRKTD